jgi:iron(III) transport system ATP-binding protein
MVFQNYALWPHMTIFENIGYGLKLKKFPKGEIQSKVLHSLNLVNLGGLEKRYPGQLSGGQQQRVALARALVLNPDVLLLDEPLSNLDAKIRIQVRAEIRKLQKELKITTVYVTHDQEEALTLSDRIAVINHGKVQQLGAPIELYERPRNAFVADFIGINNLIAGKVMAVDEAEGLIRVDTEVGSLVGISGEKPKIGEACVISVRPETASLLQNENAAEEYNCISGKVGFASYIGNTIRYDIEIGQNKIFKVDVQNPWDHQTLPVGKDVKVYFPKKVTLGILSGRG